MIGYSLDYMRLIQPFTLSFQYSTVEETCDELAPGGSNRLRVGIG